VETLPRWSHFPRWTAVAGTSPRWRERPPRGSGRLGSGPGSGERAGRRIRPLEARREDRVGESGEVSGGECSWVGELGGSDGGGD
jgi:hypothetical protein